MSYMHTKFNPKKHSKFVPKNTKKYVGKYYPICRSGLEKAFCETLDSDPKVVEWSSESFYINYMFQGKMHRYFPDFYAKVRLPTGAEDIWVVEIKHSSESKPPTKGKKSRKTILNEKHKWEKNVAKWQAAKRFCNKMGYTWKVITEKQLFK